MSQGIIIGAGIGGLTTAIALAKEGISVTIYEQSHEIKEVGAGIWVAPNGLKVYEELGISKDIITAGKALEKISIVDLNFKPISEIIGKSIERKHRFTTVAIHRAILQKILASFVPKDTIILGKKFKSYTQTKDAIIAEFDDETKVEADFLIGADGIKSNARLQMQPDTKLRYSGQTCWRFVTDFDFPNEEGNMYEVWSDKKGLRVGYSKINNKQAYVFITNYEKAGGKDNPATLKYNLLELCYKFPLIIKQLVNSCNVNDIIRTDLFDFKPLKSWTDGKIALLGDAAHATTPNLGQGASQAIEDAYVLTQQLRSNTDIEKGLKTYEQVRIKKAAYITNASWQFAKITNTSGLTKALIKGVLRWMPNSINEKTIGQTLFA